MMIREQGLMKKVILPANRLASSRVNKTLANLLAQYAGKGAYFLFSYIISEKSISPLLCAVDETLIIRDGAPSLSSGNNKFVNKK